MKAILRLPSKQPGAMKRFTNFKDFYPRFLNGPLNQFLCTWNIFHQLSWNILNISEYVVEQMPYIPPKFHSFLTKIILSFVTKDIEYMYGIFVILWKVRILMKNLWIIF